MNDRVKGLVFAMIALFSWGIHGPAGRYLALQGVDMYFVTGFRFWIGTIVFGLFLLAKKEMKINWKSNMKLTLFVSLIGLTGNSILYHMALKYLPGTLVMILENLSPVFVFVMSFTVYRIAPSGKEIFSFLTAFAGLILIVYGKGALELSSDKYIIGIILGASTGITFGFYTFFSSVLVKAVKGEPIGVIQFLFKIFVISSITMIPFIVNSGQKPYTATQWFWLIEMGVFQSGLSYLFWNYAMKYLPVNLTSILFVFTILFTTINEYLFLNLQLNTNLVIGGVLIIAAGYFISRKKKSVSEQV